MGLVRPGVAGTRRGCGRLRGAGRENVRVVDLLDCTDKNGIDLASDDRADDIYAPVTARRQSVVLAYR